MDQGQQGRGQRTTGLAAAFSYERSFYEKIIASLGLFLVLTTGAVGKLISPDYFDPTDKRFIFDWMTVMRQGGIVYVGRMLCRTQWSRARSATRCWPTWSAWAASSTRRGSTHTIPRASSSCLDVCCHFDEVNEICGPAPVPMVNKLGGSGFRITAYTQSMFDIEAR